MSLRRAKEPAVRLDHEQFLFQKTCIADEWIPLHTRSITTFRDQIIHPAMDKINEEAKHNVDIATFADGYRRLEFMQLRQATVESFCLSMHGLFERSLRGWINQFIHQLSNSDDPGRFVEPNVTEFKKRAKKQNLYGLSSLMQDCGRVPLTALPSYRVLSLLETLANACRHGDGDAHKLLLEHYPEFWDKKYREVAKACDVDPGFASARISEDLLHRFCDAIISFWNDIYCIYLLSCGELGVQRRTHFELNLENSRGYVERLQKDPLFNGQPPATASSSIAEN